MAEEHLIIFLPFLRMNNDYTVAGVRFVPLRGADGKLAVGLEAVEKPLTTILSGYIDRQGKPFHNCVVATIPGRGWDLTPADFPSVTWAASLLFLASWTSNDYFSRFGGSYVNSSYFRLLGQAYKGSTPVYIAVSARRRDGRSLDGGYKHGEFKFSMPTQCSIREPVDVDEAFLAGLGKADSAGTRTIDRLRSALPFVELANTDDDLMTENAEAILMGSAFEQLLGVDASAYKLGRKFVALFHQFGSVTVAVAQKERPGIQINTSTPELAAAQAKWWVHRKWMEELYDVRSKVVHKGSHATRKWGWEIPEHLVMGAYVFPLTVKLLLERESHYTRTDEDHARCLAVDKLLAATGWATEEDGDPRQPWHTIVSEAKSDYILRKGWDQFLKRYPDSFQGTAEAAEPTG